MKFMGAKVATFLLVLTSSSLALAEAPAESSAPPGHGEGTLELRLQTASAIAGGGVFGVVAPPGIAYATDSDVLAINIMGGVGYFISPSLALGGDLGFTRVDANGNDLTLIAIAPFVKFVTGLPERETGFFLEASPGLILADGGGVNGSTLVQLSAWLGGHFPIGASAGFLIGPYATRLDSTDDFGGGEFIVGLRLGVSVYL